MNLGPRAGISSLLIAGSIVLLISIVVGNSMGNRVLSQVARRAGDFAPSPVASPSLDPSQAGAAQVQWKRHHIVSVATDPGFPDPRITPEPPPPPPPRPPAPKRTPTPVPSPILAPSDDSHYTSPPLPLPIVTHQPGEESDPYGQPLPSASPSFEPSESPKPAASRDGAGHAAMETP